MELQWLSFPKCIQYYTSLMVYKTLNGLGPEHLLNFSMKASEIHSSSLSTDRKLLRVPFARTNYFTVFFD